MVLIIDTEISIKGLIMSVTKPYLISVINFLIRELYLKRLREPSISGFLLENNGELVIC